MGLLDVVVISLVAIVLLHFTLNNLLAKYSEGGRHHPRHEQHHQHHHPRHEGQHHPARDEMLDFVRGHLLDLEQSKNTASTPKGSNFYSEFHDSDMQPELTDLSKFFDIEQSVPDTRALLREINGPECGPNGIKDCKEPKNASTIDHQTGTPMRFDMGSDGTKTLLPDQWAYKNENPMNGGRVDGVRGFDGAASGFSLYDQPKGSHEQANFISSYPYENTFAPINK